MRDLESVVQHLPTGKVLYIYIIRKGVGGERREGYREGRQVMEECKGRREGGIQGERGNEGGGRQREEEEGWGERREGYREGRQVMEECKGRREGGIQGERGNEGGGRQREEEEGRGERREGYREGRQVTEGGKKSEGGNERERRGREGRNAERERGGREGAINTLYMCTQIAKKIDLISD